MIHALLCTNYIADNHFVTVAIIAMAHNEICYFQGGGGAVEISTYIKSFHV